MPLSPANNKNADRRREPLEKHLSKANAPHRFRGPQGFRGPTKTLKHAVGITSPRPASRATSSALYTRRRGLPRPPTLSGGAPVSFARASFYRPVPAPPAP